MSWVSRVPRQKGRARSKIHEGPRPWTQRTQDLGSFWDLGTSLVTTAYIIVSQLHYYLNGSCVIKYKTGVNSPGSYSWNVGTR